MFKVIVLALDGSEGSRGAIPLAVELATRDGARIVIAHAVQVLVGKGGPAEPLAEDTIRNELEQTSKELREQGLETTLDIRRTVLGGPAVVIKEIADEAGADLIVTGTHGHSALARAIVGSVTARLLQIEDRPVLVVPHHKA